MSFQIPDFSEESLVSLGHLLKKSSYRFVTPTPSTQSWNLGLRNNRTAFNLSDVFGWNVSFRKSQIDSELFDFLIANKLLHRADEFYQSKVRCSTIDDRFYLHSSFPTNHQASVFFGPDTYRFVRFLKSNLKSYRRIVDLGCGSGAGGLEVTSHGQSMVLADINETSLLFARANARLAGAREVRVMQSDLLTKVDGEIDCVISNPPFMIDEEKRAYRDGGENFGSELSRRIVQASVRRLSPGGSLFLYSASAVIEGTSVLKSILEKDLHHFNGTWNYEELDPDIFGDELKKSSYQGVERIAAVGITLRMNLSGGGNDH